MTWIELAPTVPAAFLASLVECVEAAPLVLAVRTGRGWKSALVGTGLALAALVSLAVSRGSLRSPQPRLRGGATLGVRATPTLSRRGAPHHMTQLPRIVRGPGIRSLADIAGGVRG